MAPGKACCISLRTGVLITGFINLAFITFLFWGVFQDFGRYMTDDVRVEPGALAFQIISVSSVFGACLLQIIGGGKNHACSLRWSYYLGITFLIVSLAIAICTIALFGLVATSEPAQNEETTQLVQFVLMFALLEMIPIAVLIFGFEIFNLVLVRALYRKIEYEAPELLINDKFSMTA